MQTHFATFFAEPTIAQQHSHQNKVRALEVITCNEQLLLASGDDDGRVCVANVEHYFNPRYSPSPPQWLVREKSKSFVCHLCAQGHNLAASYGDGRIVVYDVPTGGRVEFKATDHEPRCMAWIRDDLLAVAHGSLIRYSAMD